MMHGTMKLKKNTHTHTHTHTYDNILQGCHKKFSELDGWEG